jgi:hypothetical protein
MLEQIDLQNVLVLDIETVPQYSDFEQVPETLKKLWAAKTQYQRKDETPDDFYERAGIWAEFIGRHFYPGYTGRPARKIIRRSRRKTFTTAVLSITKKAA